MSPTGGMGGMAASPMSSSGKTVTATAAATPSLSILVDALTKANLTGDMRLGTPVYQGLRVDAALLACRPSALHQEKWGSCAAEQNKQEEHLQARLLSLRLPSRAGTLNDPNLVATVFAPTNDAFSALLKKMNMTKVWPAPGSRAALCGCLYFFLFFLIQQLCLCWLHWLQT